MKRYGGIHGNTIWNGTWGCGYFEAKSECIIVEDNVAVVGSLVVVGNELIQTGNYVYFHVTDNGKGANAPANQIRNLIWHGPVFDCDLLHPGSFFWTGIYAVNLDVEGQIDVK